MRRSAQTILILILFFVLTLTGGAAEGDATAIINKAIKAHFPKGHDTKTKGLRTKSKGTMHVAGLDLEFTQDVVVQMPNKFKEVMNLTVMDKKVKVTTVYNGKEGWIRSDDKDVKVTEEILAEFKEAAYVMGLMQGVLLNDKAVKFSLAGEAKVKGKAAVGVTVSREGKKDITVFFDKGTGLITKVKMLKRDLMSGEEVTEERFVTEYQEVSGRKVAKKVEVLRDGKPLFEAEMLETRILEKVNDSEFVQPK
jgi:hypothetical protein